MVKVRRGGVSGLIPCCVGLKNVNDVNENVVLSVMGTLTTSKVVEL